MWHKKPKNWIKRDNNLRKTFHKHEIKKIVLKSLISDSVASLNKKLCYDYFFKKIKSNTSICKIKTNCLFLFNSRSVKKKFKLSRHSCKKYAANGFITGLRKSAF